MSGPLLVGAEDVILVPSKQSYASSRPITEGLDLVLQLASFPTTRITVIAGTEDVTGADYFCKMHGIKSAGVVGVAPEDRHEELWLTQWYNVERQRAKGPIRLVLTAFPEVFARCAETHQPALLFARYGSGALATEPSSWEDLSKRVRSRIEAEIEEEVTEDEV